MKGFIEVYDRDAGSRLIAVDTIADVVEVRGYGNYGRLIRKDGSRVDCSESYAALVGKIGAAMQDEEGR